MVKFGKIISMYNKKKPAKKGAKKTVQKAKKLIGEELNKALRSFKSQIKRERKKLR